MAKEVLLKHIQSVNGCGMEVKSPVKARVLQCAGLVTDSPDDSRIE
jgi:hypothetical protein